MLFLKIKKKINGVAFIIITSFFFDLLRKSRKPRKDWKELKHSCSCGCLAPLILKKIVPYASGAVKNNFMFYGTESNGIKTQKLPFPFRYSLCAAGNNVRKLALPLTHQEHLDLGLSSYFVEKFGQVCKFKAIYLGLHSTLHTWNINRTIHDIVRRGLNEIASNYCFCKSPNNLLTYVAFILRLIYSLSTWMQLMYLDCLRKTITQSVSF